MRQKGCLVHHRPTRTATRSPLRPAKPGGRGWEPESPRPKGRHRRAGDRRKALDQADALISRQRPAALEPGKPLATAELVSAINSTTRTVVPAGGRLPGEAG